MVSGAMSGMEPMANSVMARAITITVISPTSFAMRARLVLNVASFSSVAILAPSHVTPVKMAMAKIMPIGAIVNNFWECPPTIFANSSLDASSWPAAAQMPNSRAGIHVRRMMVFRLPQKSSYAALTHLAKPRVLYSSVSMSYNVFLLLNSAQTMAVAMATLRLSAVCLPIG